MQILAQNSVTGIEAIILAVINLLNLAVSSWNARRLQHVREEQKFVADTLANGGHRSQRPPLA